MIARRRVVSPLLLLCLVWMGLPRVGLAAQDVPPAESLPELSGPMAGESEDLSDDEDWGRPERYRAPMGLRLITEAGAGLLTSAAGGAVLALGSFGLCTVTGLGNDSFFGCYLVGIVSAMVGLVEGYGLGVWWGGESVGGDGQLLFSLLGATVGALGSILVGVVIVSNQTSLDSIFVALPVVLGSHLGYELSQRAEPSSGRAARPSLQPMVGFSSRGALLGLGGRF